MKKGEWHNEAIRIYKYIKIDGTRWIEINKDNKRL